MAWDIKPAPGAQRVCKLEIEQLINQALHGEQAALDNLQSICNLGTQLDRFTSGRLLAIQLFGQRQATRLGHSLQNPHRTEQA